MHLIIKDLGTVPPGGWAYFQPQSGFWITGITFQSWLDRVAAHRSNNGYPAVTPPFELLAEEMQDYLCNRIPERSRDRICQSIHKEARVWMPGDLLALMLEQVTGKAPKACGKCVRRMQEMNTWGWWGCWKRRQVIMDWMKEEAQQRGHPMTNAGAVSLLRAAWQEIKRQRASASQS